MGDYLGATICVTEVVVLTSLLARNAAVEFLSDPRGWLPTQARVGGEGRDGGEGGEGGGRGAALLAFAAAMAAVSVWCRCVGLPDVFQKDEEGEVSRYHGNPTPRNFRMISGTTPTLNTLSSPLLSSPLHSSSFPLYWHFARNGGATCDGP